MGVAVAVLATQTGGVVTLDMVDAAVRCEVLSPLLTVQDVVAQEATVPNTMLRTVLRGGNETLATSFFS
jgi:hypothetical protein